MMGLTDQQKLGKAEFLSNFNNSWYHLSIVEKYGNHIVFVPTVADAKKLLPRTRELTAFMFTDIFWYIDILLDGEGPHKVYDIGCGHDIFKKILKPKADVIGLDPNFSDPDVKGKFEGTFEQSHQNQIQRAMSINALHFRPIIEFTDILTRYSQLIIPQGRALITFNIIRFLEHTDKSKLFQLFGTDVIHSDNSSKAFDYIENEIATFKTRHRESIDVILVDINRSRQTFDEHMDGNIKLIFDKK